MPGNLVASQGMLGTSMKRVASAGSALSLMSSCTTLRGCCVVVAAMAFLLWAGPVVAESAPQSAASQGRIAASGQPAARRHRQHIDDLTAAHGDQPIDHVDDHAHVVGDDANDLAHLGPRIAAGEIEEAMLLG